MVKNRKRAFLFSSILSQNALIKTATKKKQANDFNKSDDVTMGVTYCKIPKISPGAYIFQRPFLRGLFLEGVIFGGAYLRREICVSKLIGQTLYLEGNLLFLLCFTLYLRAISKYKPLGGLIFRGVI